MYQFFGYISLHWLQLFKQKFVNSFSCYEICIIFTQFSNGSFNWYENINKVLYRKNIMGSKFNSIKDLLIHLDRIKNHRIITLKEFHQVFMSNFNLSFFPIILVIFCCKIECFVADFLNILITPLILVII